MKTLKGLAREIVAEHRAAERDAGRALEHARRAGELLALAKQKCQHGEWKPWLAKNCALSDRTARGYMQIAREWDAIEANRRRAAAIGVSGVWGNLRLLADPEEEEDGPDPEEEAELAQLHAEALAILHDPASTAEQQEQAVAAAEKAESAAADRRHQQEAKDSRRDLYDRMASIHAKLRKLSRQDVGGETYEALLDQLDQELERRKAAA